MGDSVDVTHICDFDFDVRERGAFMRARNVATLRAAAAANAECDTDTIGDDFHAEHLVYTDVATSETATARAAAVACSALSDTDYAAAREASAALEAKLRADYAAVRSAADALEVPPPPCRATRDAAAAAADAARAEALEARASFPRRDRLVCSNIREHL